MLTVDEILALSDDDKLKDMLSGKYKDDIIIKCRRESLWCTFYYLYKLQNDEYIQIAFAAYLMAIIGENECILEESVIEMEKRFETYIDTKIGEINND